MAVAVDAGLAQTLEPDDVGVGAGVPEQLGTVAADQYGQVVLVCGVDSCSLDPVVAAGVVHRLAVEQAPDDLDALRQLSLAVCRCEQLDPGGGVLLRGVTGLERPNSKRPPDSLSTVAASHASWTGLRMSLLSTNVPRRMRAVPCATAARVGGGVGPEPT